MQPEAPRLTLALVIPTLNEAGNIEQLIAALNATVASLSEIVVVDDGSTDGTQAIVRGLSERDSRIRLIARVGKPCLTAAIQEGIDQTSAELVGWMDADGTMAASDVRRLVAEIEAGADLAVGSRFVSNGKVKGQTEEGIIGRLRALAKLANGNTEDGWLGTALSWALNAAVLPLMLGTEVHDYTSGFIVARRNSIVALRLSGDHGEYFIDLWVRAARRGLVIAEIPVTMTARVHGVSKTAENFPDYFRRGRRYLEAAVRLRLGRLDDDGVRTEPH